MIFTSVFLHLFFSWLLRIDTDTMIITSSAGLYGPAFIAPVAKALKNPNIISIGIATALLGLGIANYIGLLMSFFLRNL